MDCVVYLSAITNPTLSRMPEAGRNGNRSRDMAIPTVIRSLEEEGEGYMRSGHAALYLLEQRVWSSSISSEVYSTREKMFLVSEREVTRGTVPRDQSQHSPDGKINSHAL